jgi:hypothetical protein
VGYPGIVPEDSAVGRDGRDRVKHPASKGGLQMRDNYEYENMMNGEIIKFLAHMRSHILMSRRYFIDESDDENVREAYKITQDATWKYILSLSKKEMANVIFAFVY